MERACRKQADVLFLIDATSSIDYEYWKTHVLGFVSDVIRQLNVDSGRTRVAVVSYSDTAKVTKDLNSLASRREDISRKFFQDITKSTSCLHHLLLDPKSPSHNSRLRSYEIYPWSYTRTKRYCSFVQYALSHYQDRLYNK